MPPRTFYEGALKLSITVDTDPDTDVITTGNSHFTKAELVAALDGLPDDAPILVECDPEGEIVRPVRMVLRNWDVGDGHGYSGVLVTDHD